MRHDRTVAQVGQLAAALQEVTGDQAELAYVNQAAYADRSTRR
jgi:hypothetical protein